jgi:hypothetical protein
LGVGRKEMIGQVRVIHTLLLLLLLSLLLWLLIALLLLLLRELQTMLVSHVVR